MTTQTYATQPTQYYINAVAAFEAGGAALNIAGGTLVVGDGNGAVPSISALIAANSGAGGVTHEVWRGATINSVAIDPNNAAQLDIECVIPSALGGVEIGPFAVTEFAILDATGACCIVGTTNLQKTTSTQGQTSDLAWIAAVVVGVGAVIVTPPSAGFATMTQVIEGFDANLPSCVAPLTKADTTNSGGWLNRVFGIATASQPAGTTPAQELAAMGAGRAATNAEFTAGAPESGAAMVFPWPTLQQVAAALAAIWVAVTALQTAVANLVTALATYVTPAQLAAAIAALTGAPPFNIHNSTSQSLSSNVWTNVNTLTGSGNADLSLSASALTVQTAGHYVIVFSQYSVVTISAADNIWQSCAILINAVQQQASNDSNYCSYAGASNPLFSTTTWTGHLAVGDVITFQAQLGADYNFRSGVSTGIQISAQRVS